LKLSESGFAGFSRLKKSCKSKNPANPDSDKITDEIEMFHVEQKTH